MEKFYSDNLVIRDEKGRERIFKGVNVCVKADKVNTDTMEKHFLSEKVFTDMAACGINIIRLGTTWASIEPKQGEYNGKLIALYKKFVNKCLQHGIYVLLDMHQDLFSSYFHDDGVPKWAIDKNIKSKKPFAIWAEGYFYMDSVAQAFNDFWNNKNHIQNSFIKAWQYYAMQFQDCDNIIGLDYLNEPFVHQNGRTMFLHIVKNICTLVFGKSYDYSNYFKPGKDKLGFALMAIKLFFTIRTKKRLLSLLSTLDSAENFDKVINGLGKYTEAFNKQYYQPFIERMSSEVNLNNSFAFFEHNYYSNLGIPFEIKAKDNYIYSPHAYDFFIDSPLYNNFSSNERMHSILEHIRENQVKMNVPIIFGEWGGGGPKGGKWIEHIDYVMSQFEKYHWSSIYWSFDFKDKKLLEVFNRPYPVAVCGDIIKIKTNSNKKTFYLEWQQSSDFENKNVQTIIFIPNKGFVNYPGKTGLNTINIDY
ncbi:MAG: cellulase family glycosylhydrolase [Clostridium sp.]|nr:cellulase family glycosylhydrolase [Clostridium sp.]